MRLYYDYRDIQNLKNNLRCQIDKINNTSIVMDDEIVNEINKLLISYDEVLIKLKPEGKITDFRIVQSFNETKIFLKIIDTLL